MQGNLLAFNDAMMKLPDNYAVDIYDIGNVAKLYYRTKQRETMTLFRQQESLWNFRTKISEKGWNSI